jgi:methylenetetrahydrofolate dehydrogenase (NADP+)/methenyltetrahydrofolate cyclohydrolase
MIVLDGKIASAAVKAQLKAEIDKIKNEGKRVPHLAAILVGNNGASETYVASKVKNCTEVGFDSTLIRLNDDVTEKELIATIEKLNNDNNIDGILVQLPLPNHINEANIIYAINPAKDVDGFHPTNAGKLMLGLPTFIPATPYGIMLMLEHYHIHTKGKHAVIIGRSNIVGRPMSILLSSNNKYGNCTVTLCHSHTPNLEAICKQADILVAALGKPEFVTSNLVKPGAIVIDVGITRVEDKNTSKGFKIKGDVNYNEVAPITQAITPVPGGVGLMTIAGLLKNTLQAYKLMEENK